MTAGRVNNPPPAEGVVAGGWEAGAGIDVLKFMPARLTGAAGAALDGSAIKLLITSCALRRSSMFFLPPIPPVFSLVIASTTSGGMLAG